MKILIINAGSSSIKFSVFDTDTDTQLFKHEMERLSNVEEGMKQVSSLLKQEGYTQFDAIGQRIAHGGALFKDATVITPEVVKTIERFVPLAPLHNPPGLAGIKMAQSAWPDVMQVAVFDTAFHQHIPSYAYTYAVPKAWREKGVRRYGFHGASHKYVMLKTSETLKCRPEELRIISCHLGNGASVCAIDRGVSVDNSMGMTALEGLVMGSRSGDVDPGMFAFLYREMGLKPDAVEEMLYSQSGLKALSGFGNDMRDIETKAAEGNKDAMLAIQVYAYRVRRYIGAFAASMGGVDVLAFTGGIGEHSASMRRRVCDRLEFLGLYLDEDKNNHIALTDHTMESIHQPHSRVKVMVTETREQWMIAQEVQRIADDSHSKGLNGAIPIAVSAHHVHLTQESVEILFGKGHVLTKYKELSQPGFWAAEEHVDIIGPNGEIKHVRVLGPCRSHNQIEVAETETFSLGLHVPVRISGDVRDTPVVTLRGTAGTIKTDGIIVAKRHIHLNSKDAVRLNLKKGDIVEVEVQSEGRDLVFRDVEIRVDERYVTEMHIDTDEANAAHISAKGTGVLTGTESNVHITRKLR
jgi:acetate kinase